MQRLGYCVLLLVIVLLPNKSRENASLYRSNNDEEYDNTTHFTNFSSNNSGQTLREAFRENSNGNSLWEETKSTSTSREKLDEEQNDEFGQRNVTKNVGDQAFAYKTVNEILVTPIRYKDGIHLTIKPCDNTTKDKKYIQFCCPLGYRLSLERGECFVDRTVTFPFAYKEKMVKNTRYRFCNVGVFGSSFINCSGTQILIKVPSDYPYTFLDDATVHFAGDQYLVSSRYCLAAVYRAAFDLIFCGVLFDVNETHPYVLVATIVSLIFLLITVVVYSALQEFRNMHGYTLRAYLVSLFVANALYAVYIYLTLKKKIYYSVCASLGYIFFFAMYSTFLWLNVTCFDMWRTFRGFLPIHKKRTGRRKKMSRMSKTFVSYALYAWGVSFVVTILTVIMDFVPNIPDYLIKPQICEPKFWFGSEQAKILYFYVPVGVTLICNICLFVWTALKILCDKKRINRQMKDSESRRHDDCNKQRAQYSLWLYLKLFIIMGVNWFPMNLTVGIGTPMFEDKWNFYLWFVADLLTPLQGVIIFIIFVCKKTILSSLIQRFGWSSDSSFRWFRVRSAERPILRNTTTRAKESKEVQEMQLQATTYLTPGCTRHSCA